jgi:hypothetical protein
MNKYINIFLNTLENLRFREIFINVPVGVGMMTLFLTIFYYYYVLEVEHIMIKDNITIMISNLIEPVKPFFTQDTINYIQNQLKNTDMKEADASVKKSNNLIKNESIKIMTIISIVCILIGYVLSRYLGVNFYNVVKSNLIVLTILAFTEYSFLHMLPSKIITGDPNFVKYKVLVNLKNKIKFE